MNTPKLRFKGFTDSWETKKIKDIATVNQGLQIPISDRHYENGENRFFYITNEFLKPSSKVKYYIENPPKSVLCNEEDILMTRTGNTGQVVSNVSGAFHNNFFKINYNKSLISRDYLTNFLKLKTTQHIIMTYAGQSTIPDLNHSDFYKIKVSYPNLKEQEKIGLFVNELERKIRLQQEKTDLLKEQKKGYMQKIFSREIRFKDKKGREYPDWSKQKLGNFTERVTRKNSDLVTTRPLTISAQHGLIDQVEFFNKTVASENLTGYYLLNKGEFAYNKSYSNGYPLGAIKRLDDYENGALSTLYICFTPKDNVNSDFLVHYFNSTQWYKEVSLICVEGARNHGLLNVSVSEFFDTLHYLPCLEEQLKIAKFFDCINQKIKLNERTLKNLQDQKQAFMQQMFI
ncbi:EcoKI restriction-modification system protein HsdS [Mycobacteroides abscessus subsp. abscessus]|nr:EcoKI restriction-modification system protein HsdS [Mycobacteroides abscessus subsp. abscessus]